MGFHVTHLDDAKFERRGLRSYFEYRDLGIKRISKGKVVAHVIRARPGKAPHGEWHLHDCRLQFVYVLKGWVEFEYEGVGRVKMKAGTCFYQPPRIRHREIRHSRNLELIEIVAPANFRTRDARVPVKTRNASAPSLRPSRRRPAARKSPARRSRG